MSRWDILLDRTNQAKIKTDYVNEVNKENEKKYWKERCDKAQDKFFDMIKAEELKEIFDLFEALGGPRFYWEHELGRHPYEVNPQWKDVCPDSRWAGGPDYTEDRDLGRIGIGTRHGSGRIAYIPCLRMRFDDPDWGINWNYLSVEIYLNKDNHIILHQDGYSYSDRHSVDVFNAMDENKRTAIIYEHFVKAYPEFIKNFERIAENEIQKKEMSLENVEKVYMIIKSEPAELPSPTNNRDTKTFKNSIFIKDDDDNYVSEQTAEKTLYTAPNILKELGQVFKYDGKKVTNLQIGADKTDSGTVDTSKICTDLLNGSRGVFVSWAFKVNYDGKLNGEYSVLEDIPEGMELSYIRVKWHGEDASSVRSKEISGIDSTVWEKVNNTSTNDNKNSEETIYYVNKNNKQAMIQLGDFVAKEERDNNSVDVQVVCRVTDSKVLLGAKPQTFTNKVTLKKDGKDIDTATSPETIQLKDEDKNIDKKQVQGNGQKIDFEINANQLGQTLPTNDGDKLKLVDELGENLQLDTDSIKVFENNTELLTNCKTSYTNNTLEITIPNNVPIKITYTVTVNAKPDEPVKVSNTAYWKGYSKESGKTVGDTYSYKVGGGIEAFSKVNFKLTKQDQNNLNNFLQKAEFKIEKLDENNEFVSTEEVSKITDASGTITQDLDFDTLYKITEIKAPDGYVLDSKPIYILDLNKREKDTSYLEKVETFVKDNKLNVIYKQQNFDIQVQNHKGEITVVKKFINDAAGKSTKPVSGTYTFGLYTDKNDLRTPLQKVSITYNAGETKDKSEKFNDLELGKTYYVFELDDKGNPIVNSSQEVTINKLQYTVEYKNEKGEPTNDATNGQTVTVTNRSRTKILPSTGGYGSLLYRISGAMLALASLIYLTNIYKKNHLDDTSKKRRKK